MTSGAGTTPQQARETTVPQSLIADARARAAHLYPNGMPDTQVARINGVLRDAQERATQEYQQAT
jgi:hypothetical protein